MTPAELNLIGTMMVQAKPEGVIRIGIEHQYGFQVFMAFDGHDGKIDVATETGATLDEAFRKADVSRLRKIDAARSAADIAAAEVASWGMVA